VLQLLWIHTCTRYHKTFQNLGGIW